MNESGVCADGGLGERWFGKGGIERKTRALCNLSEIKMIGSQGNVIWRHIFTRANSVASRKVLSTRVER